MYRPANDALNRLLKQKKKERKRKEKIRLV